MKFHLFKLETPAKTDGHSVTDQHLGCFASTDINWEGEVDTGYVTKILTTNLQLLCFLKVYTYL